MTHRIMNTLCVWLVTFALVNVLANLPSDAAAAEGITIFMIGDSTMADKPVIPENPEAVRKLAKKLMCRSWI